MSNQENVKGSKAAAGAGGLICIYSSIAFIMLFIMIDKFSILSALALALSAISILVGVGIIKHNYYAWLIAIVLNSIFILLNLANIGLLFMSGNSATASNIASKSFMPILIFYMLYLAKDICKNNKSINISFYFTIKQYLHVLIPSALTIITVFVLKWYELASILILGFPILIIEFTIAYVLSLKIQKRLGWAD